MRDLETFGVFSPVMGTQKNIPSLLLSEAITPDNDKVVLIDGEIHRRPMREYYLTSQGSAVQTPDENPVMEIVSYIKESTDTEYLLVFTKKHIYLWNSAGGTLDSKYTATNDVAVWDYCFFNDQIVVTSDTNEPIIWDAAGNFTPINTYGAIVSVAAASTTVDADSNTDQKVLNVAATGDFAVGDVVVVDDGGDKEEVCKIASIDAGVSITMVDNLQYTHTGADTDEVAIATCITKAKFVTEYYRYLIIGYPYLDQDARWYPQGIYISKLGDETDFESASAIGYFGIGESGEIKGFGFYNNLLYIFKDKSRVQFYPGSGSEYFNYSEINDKFGLLATHSVMNDDKGNMYYLATDYTIKKEGFGTISQLIQTDILDEIEPDQLDKIRSAFVDDYKELMWALPVDSAENNYIICYKEGIWVLIKDVNITAFSDYYV